MTTKHTPAPWINVMGIISSIDSKLDIAEMYSGYENSLADAYLVAAAPDLLEALIACNDAMEYMSEYDIPIMLPQQVRDAIAKASCE